MAVITSVAYGYQVGSEEDEFVRLLEKSFELSNALNVPGKFWVEYFPACELNALSDIGTTFMFVISSAVHPGMGPRRRIQEVGQNHCPTVGTD